MGMAFDRSPEGSASLDGLELFGIADQHHLGARRLRSGQHPFHLACADQTGFIDHQHVAGAQRLTSRDLGVVVGYAGTGKSALLGVAREASDRQPGTAPGQPPYSADPRDAQPASPAGP